MSAFMSDRTPEERRYFRLQMLVYDILRAEDGGRIVTPRMVDGFVDQIMALDAEAASPLGGPTGVWRNNEDGDSSNASLPRALPGAHTNAEPAAEGEP